MIDFIFEQLKAYGDEICMIHEGRKYSYAQLVAQTLKYKVQVAENIEPGAVVGVHVDYSFHSLALFFALALNQIIIIPLAEAAKQKHKDFIEVGCVEVLANVEKDNLIKFTSRSKAPAAMLYEKIRSEKHSGLVLFSSGSSGKPKGIVHDLDKFVKAYEKPGKSLKTLIFLQMDHIGGINTFFYNLRNKGTIVIPKSRRPDDICNDIAAHQVELLPTSPTFLNLLILSNAVNKYDLSSLKLITYGTEPMPETTLLRLKQVLPNVRLKQTYGLSETGILQTQSKSDNSLWVKLGGDGFDIKIVDNKLWIRSNVSMLGYLNAENPIEDDGYMNTGDVVEQEGDWVKILGRESELINVGGNKVFPQEVESVLQQMDEVEDVVVHGKANNLNGQMVVATIKLKDPLLSSDFKIKMRKF